MPSTRTRFSVVVQSNQISAVRNRIRDNVRAIVLDSAQSIQDYAQAIAPRDTGSLEASIYVNDGNTSDYTSCVAEARSLNRDVEILDEIDPEFVISLSTGDDNAYTCVVGVAAGHGIFQEFGTRFMRASPFLTVAALGEQNRFESAMAHVAD